MARQLQQLSAVQASFAARIQQKVREERAVAQETMRVPLFGWLLMPIAGFFFDTERSNQQYQGDRGEARVVDGLTQGLPDSWTLFHNAVIEPEPDTFAQIDTLLIGPPGVFLIETKAWRGSFTAYRDTWKRREGRQWTPCHSPTKQSIRHAIVLRQWLGQFWNRGLPGALNRWVHPLVVFTHAEWLGITECTVPVFRGTSELLQYLKTQTDQHLTPGPIDSLADLIMRTPLPPERPVAPPPAPRPPERPAPPAVQTPLCPRCAIPMVLRTAKSGPHAGQSFYGCKNFPACREMQPINRPP